MAVMHIVLACVLSAEIVIANNIQRMNFGRVQPNAKPSSSPQKSFQMYSLLQCATFCSRASTCKSMVYGQGICYVYDQDFPLDNLNTATGFHYYRLGDNAKTMTTTEVVTSESTKIITTTSIPGTPRNVAKKMATTQSSEYTYSSSSAYAVDGKDDATKPTLAASCSSTNAEDDTKPWWRIKLPEELVLRSGSFFTSSNDEFHDIEIRIGNDDIKETSLGSQFTKNPICVGQAGYVSSSVLLWRILSFRCPSAISGQYLSLQITDFCQDTACKMQDANILSLCKVIIYPDVGNVAVRKPAKQSGTYSTMIADRAVDGNYDPNQFSHTNPELKYPWWRVDLLKDHYVKGIIITNRMDYDMNKRFHDVEIRVSQTDIADLDSDIVFIANDEDTLCNTVATGPTLEKFEIKCKKGLAGRYVSMQIVKVCTSSMTDCNPPSAPKQNIIHVVEVEVIGVPLSYGVKPAPISVPSCKQSSNYNSQHSAANAVDMDVNTFQKTNPNQKHPWWRADMAKEYYVIAVNVVNMNDESSQRFHDVEIRVSSEDIASIAHEHVFKPKDDSLCAKVGADEPLPPAGPNVIKCEKPLAGRYISVQIVDDCKTGRTDCNVKGDSKSLHLLQMAEFQVIGLPLNEELEDLWKKSNVAALTPEQDTYVQSSTWGGVFTPDLALKITLATTLYTATAGQCAFTDYTVVTPAWWRVTLDKVYEVKKVIVFTPAELHDFAIRVGTHSITPPPTTNSVCQEGKRLQLSDGKAEVECNSPLSGKYVSIEVKKPCLRSECVFFKSTALYLCEVEVETV